MLEVTRQQCESRWLSAALLGLSAACVVIAVAMSVEFNGAVVAGRAKTLASASAGVVDTLTLCLAVSAGLLMRSGRRVGGIATGLLAVAFGLFTWASITGYGLASRIGHADATKATQTRALAAAETARVDRVDRIAEQTRWLRGRIANSNLTNAERKAASAELAALTSGSWTATVVLGEVTTDVQANIIAELFNVSERSIQLLMVSWLATLLILGKLVGGSLGAFLWPRRPAKEAVVSSGVVQPATNHLPIAEVHSEQEALASEAALPFAWSAAKTSQPEQGRLALDDEPLASSVAEFFHQRTAPTSIGYETTGVIFASYVVWCQRTGREAASLTAFGLGAAKLGVPKSKVAGRYRYAVRLLASDSSAEAA
jgi:hypothetical protein